MLLILGICFAVVLPSDPASAACSDLVFLDGFEIGDTSRWTNSAAPARADGTWMFDLNFTGSIRAFALELVQQQNGAVVGHLFGGTPQRVLVNGSATGTAVNLELELNHPTASRTIIISGTLDRTTITGTASGDIVTQAVTLQRTYCELSEQMLAAATDAGGPEPEHLRVLSVVLDEDANFVAGGFVGDEDCDLWACDGGLTSFSEVGDVVTVGLETDGGCSAGSSFTVNWNPGGIYLGTYTFTDCGGTTSSNLLAAFGMGTSSSDVREILEGRVEIADALESGVPLMAPPNGVSSTFLNFGKDEPTLRAELNTEMGGYSSINIDLERARYFRTTVHPRALPDLVESFGFTIDEQRTGIPSGGGDPVTYRDLGSRPIIDDLAIVGLAGDEWKVTGNQAPGLDLPFAYTIPSGSSRLEAPTPGGTVWVSLGPYGGHFGPLTGDPSGEAKANFVGFLAEDDTDMQELVGDGDGIREPGETWGFPIGGDLTGDAVRLRRPLYTSPADGVVRSLRYEEVSSPIHFDNEPQWKVEIGLPGDVRYAIGHVGKIAPDLRALVLAATGVNTDSFGGPVGTDLLEGFDPIPVAAGTGIAWPQILAAPVPGFPGYWVGEGSFLEWPWAQIEFQVPFGLGEGGDLGSDFCVYRFFSGSRRSELQALMDADMLDLNSQRYRDRLFYDRWQWTAQGGLCQAENVLPRDFSDLYTSLGGWTERSEPGTFVDELFSWVPIDTTAGAYNPANYDSAAVSHLVIRNRQPGFFSWMMPDGTTATVFLAVGEVLERSPATMLIKWRDFNPTNPVVYQRLAYRLDTNGLTIKWGNFAGTEGASVQPTLQLGDPCDDTAVLCYDHSIGAWPP